MMMFFQDVDGQVVFEVYLCWLWCGLLVKVGVVMVGVVFEIEVVVQCCDYFGFVVISEVVDQYEIVFVDCCVGGFEKEVV